MARAKKKTPQELAWEHYRSVQLTPEQKAAARVELRQELDELRDDRV
ncbi:MAG TPA: hypothetical protein VGF48_22035 [Thermoanaerobaculia bacterium]